MDTFVSHFIALSAGASILVNGVLGAGDDLARDAAFAANRANLHQLATVLELYYMDHGSYPFVTDGPALIDELYRGEYLRTKPLDSEVFKYAVRASGEDFYLALASDAPGAEEPLTQSRDCSFYCGIGDGSPAGAGR